MLHPKTVTPSIMKVALLGTQGQSLDLNAIPDSFRVLAQGEPEAALYQIVAAMMCYEQACPLKLKLNSFSTEEFDQASSQGFQTKVKKLQNVLLKSKTSELETTSTEATDKTDAANHPTKVGVASQNASQANTQAQSLDEEQIAQDKASKDVGKTGDKTDKAAELTDQQAALLALHERWQKPNTVHPLPEVELELRPQFSEQLSNLVLKLLPYPWLLFYTLREIADSQHVLSPNLAFKLAGYIKGLELNRFVYSRLESQLYSYKFLRPIFTGFTLREMLFKLGGLRLQYIFQHVPIGRFTTAFSKQLPPDDGSELFYTKLWGKANNHERVGIFLTLRWLYPALSRKLVSSSMSKFTSDDRMQIASGFLINLSNEDEDSLIGLWRSNTNLEVRSRCMDVLRELPNSKLAKESKLLVLQHVNFVGNNWQLESFQLEDELKSFVIPAHRFNRTTSTSKQVGLLLDWCDLGTIFTLASRGLAYFGEKLDDGRLVPMDPVVVSPTKASQSSKAHKAIQSTPSSSSQAANSTTGRTGESTHSGAGAEAKLAEAKDAEAESETADKAYQAQLESLGYVGLFESYPPEERREKLRAAFKFMLQHYQIFDGIISNSPRQCIGVKVAQAHDPVVSQVFMECVMPGVWQHSFEYLLPDLPQAQLEEVIGKRNVLEPSTLWLQPDLHSWPEDFATTILQSTVKQITPYFNIEMINVLCFGLPYACTTLIESMISEREKRIELTEKMLKTFKGTDKNTLEVMHQRSITMEHHKAQVKFLAELKHRMTLKAESECLIDLERKSHGAKLSVPGLKVF